jgi:YegS/Rv2252/BmrU family lipid kinase
MSKKNKSMHVKLLANPNAGDGDASEAADNLKLVIGYLEKNGFRVDVAFTTPKEEATPVARQAGKNGYKLIIAMGGDGTIEAVMRGMVGSKARLGIIPAGTENNIAKSLGIPSDLEKACALIASDYTLKLDVGQVKTRKGKKFVFFEMATIGLSATIYPDANKVASGKYSRIKATALTFFHQDTKPKVFLTFNDESNIDVETMLVMVSNTPIFGKNFMVAPVASLQDGLLDISTYPDFSKVELIRYYAAIMDEGYSGDKKAQHYQARKIKVKASPKLDVMADGVALGRGTVTIKVLPGALRVITTEENIGVESPQKSASEKMPESVPPADVKKQKESVISLGKSSAQKKG